MQLRMGSEGLREGSVGRMLAGKHKDPSSDAQYLCMTSHACNSNTGWWTQDPRDSLASQPSKVVSPRYREKLCLKK